MARNEIFMVELPVPKGAHTSEQFGIRPAVIIQADDTHSFNTVVIVPMTAKQPALRYPHTFLVQPSKQNGLGEPSVLMVFQLRAIDRARLRSKLGTLENQHVNRLEREIRELLNL